MTVWKTLSLKLYLVKPYLLRLGIYGTITDTPPSSVFRFVYYIERIAEESVAKVLETHPDFAAATQLSLIAWHKEGAAIAGHFQDRPLGGDCGGKLGKVEE